MKSTTTGVQPGDVDDLTALVGKKTPHRLNALRWTGEGAVSYDRVTASWMIHGEAIGGWDFRTLTGLRQAGALIVTPDKSDPSNSIVDLSPVGRGLLDRWLD